MLKVKQPPTELRRPLSSSSRKRKCKINVNNKFSILKKEFPELDQENIDLNKGSSTCKSPIEENTKKTLRKPIIKESPTENTIAEEKISSKKKTKKTKDEVFLENQIEQNNEAEVGETTTTNTTEENKEENNIAAKINFAEFFQKMSEYFMALHNPSQILFREQETQQITEFLNNCFEMTSNERNLLVTGKPGCGKTLTVNNIVENEIQKSGKDILFLKFNAMALKNSQSLRDAIFWNLFEKKKKQKTKTDKLAVILIDEIESLFGKSNAQDQDILDIFKEVNYPNSKICLIGISNSMELLYKIGKKHDCNLDNIKNIVFKSYDFEQIMKIIEERIEDFMVQNGLKNKVDSKQILEEKALKLCAARVFNLKGGDIRCILEILMKTLSRHSEKYSTLENKHDLLSITLSDLINVLEEIYNERKINEIIGSLPVIQQSILLILYKIFADSDKKEMELSKILSLFNNLVSDFGIPRHNATDFIQGLKILETYYFIEIKQASKIKNVNIGDNSIVKLQIKPEDIKSALVSNETFEKYF